MLPAEEYDPGPGGTPRAELIQSLLSGRRDSTKGIPIIRSALGYELLTAAQSGALGERWQVEASTLRLPRLGG